MGSSLAANQILSTYAGVLKTSDTSGLNATLRSVSDGVGTDSALQVSTLAVYSTGTLGATGAVTFLSTLNVTGIATLSSALNVAGNLAIATNKFTVAAASGNTVVAGTLNVAGAFVSTSTGSFSGNLSTSQTLTCRQLTQNDAAASSSFAGTLTASGNFNASGTSTFSGSVVFNSLVSFVGGVSASSLTATSTSTLASATASSLTVTGAASVTGNLSVTGNITGNGNVTIGDAGADSLTLNAATWTTPNLPTATLDAANDFILIRDVSDSNRVKLVTAASISGQVFSSGNIAISGITTVSPSVSGNWSQVQMPDRAQFWFRCKTAHSGFLVGDRIPVSSVYVSGGGEPFFQNHYNDSGWALYRVSYTATPEIKVALTGVPLTFNLSNWDFLAIAEWLS